MKIQRLLEVTFVLLPLVCWPNLDRPFSTPKIWLLAVMVLAVAAHWFRWRNWLRLPAWPWLAWLAALALSAVAASYVSIEALLLTLLPAALYFSPLPPERIGRALPVGSAIESGIAVLQYCRFDPLRLLGWIPEVFPNPRMRVYGTLGNPDFVAAFLCATLPLYAGVASRAWRAAGLALQIAAILATGSRVSLLALPVAAAVLALRGVKTWKWLLAGAPAAALLLWLSPARSFPATIEGRMYLTRVTAAHWSEIPPVGHGPGAFPLRFAAWQVDWLRDSRNRENAREFAGPVDHAHNDYVEMWVNYGPAGLCAFLVLCGWLMATAWKEPASPWRAGAWSGLAGLLAIACVDFPFHRPAEWGLFWVLFGMLGSGLHGRRPATYDTHRRRVDQFYVVKTGCFCWSARAVGLRPQPRGEISFSG
jgi:putative inorganic carbon (HCO3(-)) transporter